MHLPGTIKIERSVEKEKEERSYKGVASFGEVITNDLETPFTVGVAVYL